VKTVESERRRQLLEEKIERLLERMDTLEEEYRKTT
jgi:hypothetical protein